MVEVITAEVSVTVGRFNLKHAVAKFKNRDIESTATEVKHGYLLVLVGLVKTVCECCGCRLVNDTLDGKTCDLAGFLGCLTLRIVEVGRNGDYRFSH